MRRADGLRRREPAVGDRLPYLAQIDPRTLLLRDGSLMTTLRINGLAFETADTDELNYRKQQRDAALRATASSRLSIYHHIVRRLAAAPVPGCFPDAFSTTLDQAWTRRMSAKRLYLNELYISVVRRPARSSGLWKQGLSRFLFGADETTAATLGDEIRTLAAACDGLLAALAPYGARPLETYAAPDGVRSELLEFLSLIYNGETKPVRLPHADVGHHLPYRRLYVGHQALEFSPGLDGQTSYAAIVSLKDYPGSSTVGMLDTLLRLPSEMVLTQSFAFVDRTQALGRVNLAMRRMLAADDEAVSLRDELSMASDDIAAGRAAFGEHHLTVMVRGQALEDIDKGAAEVRAAMGDLGMVGVREDLGLEPAYWAQFPGNTAFIARRALVSTRNFASFASAHNFSLGQRNDLHWHQPVTMLETSAAGPYAFNFHVGDLGNFTVIGPSGSGKTVVLNFLLAQARRFDPQIVFFDKDRGAEPFLRAIGGRYSIFRPGEPSGLNPLKLADTPANHRFLVTWLSLLVCPSGTLDAEDTDRIEEAVKANFAAPPPLRRLSAFADLVRGGARPNARDLYARLRPWFGTGEHAWLFDNDLDTTDKAERVVGFDMTRLLDEPILRTPTMMYLFHRVEERLDSTPAIIVVDEGWKALDDPIFRQRIRDWEKTIRKRNGLVGFVTQNAEDALKSEIAADIVEQAATQIFMGNPRGQYRDYVEGFGLTPYELDLIRALPTGEHCFLVKQARQSAVVRLNLHGETELLAVLSGREQTVRLLDEIRTRKGDAPSDWMPELLAALA